MKAGEHILPEPKLDSKPATAGSIMRQRLMEEFEHVRPSPKPQIELDYFDDLNPFTAKEER